MNKDAFDNLYAQLQHKIAFAQAHPDVIVTDPASGNKIKLGDEVANLIIALSQLMQEGWTP